LAVTLCVWLFLNTSYQIGTNPADHPGGSATAMLSRISAVLAIVIVAALYLPQQRRERYLGTTATLARAALACLADLERIQPAHLTANEQRRPMDPASMTVWLRLDRQLALPLDGRQGCTLAGPRLRITVLLLVKSLYGPSPSLAAQVEALAESLPEKLRTQSLIRVRDYTENLSTRQARPTLAEFLVWLPSAIDGRLMKTLPVIDYPTVESPSSSLITPEGSLIGSPFSSDTHRLSSPRSRNQSCARQSIRQLLIDIYAVIRKR
jgi:hypothetical protein